jgi:hypothetical protein
LILIQILQKKGIKFRGRRRGYYIKKNPKKTRKYRNTCSDSAGYWSIKDICPRISQIVLKNFYKN